MSVTYLQKGKPTYIYPFAKEGLPPDNNYLIIWEGEITIDLERLTLDPDNAERLIEALKQAVEIAQKGQK